MLDEPKVVCWVILMLTGVNASPDVAAVTLHSLAEVPTNRFADDSINNIALDGDDVHYIKLTMPTIYSLNTLVAAVSRQK